MSLCYRETRNHLKQYYEAKRQSPILGSEAFIERVREAGCCSQSGASTV